MGRVSHVVLSNGAAFAVLSPTGDIRTETSPEAGFFHDDTRYLSQSTLEIEGGQLRQLSSEVTREYVSQIDLSIKAESSNGERDDPQPWISLGRRRRLRED